MKKGDVVLVDFSGKELVTNQLFDTTIEADAKKNGVFNPKALYKPVPIVVGKKELPEKVDAELERMEVGEEKTVELEPKDAFGERKSELIGIIPLQQFKNQKMQPIPGLIIEADGRQGKVQSVSGGRVRVDFNHPLAGKKVEYKIIVKKKLEGKQEQAEAIFEKFFPHVQENEAKIKVAEKNVQIVLPERLKEQRETGVLKRVFAQILPEQLEGIEKVEFVETLEEAKAEAPKKEAAKSLRKDH